MTKEEMQQIQERLSRAQTSDGRIRRLTEAAVALSGGSVLRLNLSFVPGEQATIRYVEDPDEPSRWKTVCWGIKEEGLHQEVFEAVKAIIERRKAEAEAELLSI